MGKENVIMPVPDVDSEPFWKGCRSGHLLIQRCKDCGATQFPPRPVCHVCRGTQIDWVQSKGMGRIYSWIVVHHPLLAELEPAVPYIVALIELDEGVILAANLRNCRPEDVKADMQVRVVFERISDEYVIPQFEVC